MKPDPTKKARKEASTLSRAHTYAYVYEIEGKFTAGIKLTPFATMKYKNGNEIAL